MNTIVAEPELLQGPGVRSAVQVLRDADAVHTLGHREVRVDVTVVPTVDGHEVTVGVAEAIQRQDEGKLTWRTRLSVRKYKAWKKKHLPPTPVDTVIEIDRAHVHEPSTWLLANVNLLVSCDEIGAQTARQVRSDATRPRGRQRRRCLAQLWRGRTNERPKILSLVTYGRVGENEADLNLDTAAQVSVISDQVYFAMRSPELHPVDAFATAANGANLKLLGA